MEELKNVMANANWTSDYFAGVIRKYVPRDKIPHSFLEELKTVTPGLDLEIRYMMDVLAKFIDESPEMQAMYESPQSLLFHLHKYQYFSNSSLYFSKGLNYQNGIVIFSEFLENGLIRTFMSKQDAIATLFKKERRTNNLDIFGDGIKKSVLNKLGEELDGKFELIPKLKMEQNYTRDFKMIKCPDYSMINQVDKTSHCFENVPRDKVVRFLKNVCDYNYSLELFFRNAEWFKEKYPVLRIFEDQDKFRMMFAKEAEDILTIVMQDKYRKPFPTGLLKLETEEERQLGILKTVDVLRFENIMKILKLEYSDLYVVNCKIHVIGKVHSVPIPTPYGTFCKIASCALLEFFDELSFGMDLFKGVKPENIPIISKFFEDLITDTGVFSTKRSNRYFIETSKLDEIYEKAYAELKILITEPIPRFNFKEVFNRKGAFEEVCRFTVNLSEEDKKEIDAIMKKRIWKDIGDSLSAKQVIEIYHESTWDYMNKKCAKLAVFLEIQGIIDVYGPELYEQKIITVARYSEIFRNAFMKLLPNIPPEPTMTEREMIAYVRREMGETFRVDDEPKLREFMKFIEKFIERVHKNGDVYVKRRPNPGGLPVELFARDPVLSQLFLSSANMPTDEMPRLYGEMEGRLEELLVESTDEDEQKSILDLIDNFKNILK